MAVSVIVSQDSQMSICGMFFFLILRSPKRARHSRGSLVESEIVCALVINSYSVSERKEMY